MVDVYLTNTLTRKKEKFIPVSKNKVGIYSCGPTVYWYQHIGNMYAYVQWDVLVRFLKHIGYDVNWVMNITDVGHMTGDNVGAADTGEDRMEKGAKREGVSVWEIADKYIRQNSESMKLLNITQPDVTPRATKHIDEQISLARKIERKGFTYQTKMGLVFDTSKFDDYTKFANLKLDKQEKRADVQDDPEKKLPWDFFLWVTGNPKHVMQWDSPWGRGFPGWHIECTAMSVKYLGNNFDIHTGGSEHIPVHHTDEIAQGYGAFGKQTANYWLHNAWLLEKSGKKASKSKGGFMTVGQLVKKGYDPIALRYLFLTSHYKKGMNFTWDALDAASTALNKLKDVIGGLKETKKDRETISKEKLVKAEKYRDEFTNSLADDINTPKALSVLWAVIKSNIPSGDKLDLILTFDEVLGLGFANVSTYKEEIPESVIELAEKRLKLREVNDFEGADKVRKEIEGKGFSVKDTPKGYELKPVKKR